MLPVKLPPRPTKLYEAGRRQQGCVIILLGGKPGSRLEDLASSIVDELDERYIAVESVADESFHFAVQACKLCTAAGPRW